MGFKLHTFLSSLRLNKIYLESSKLRNINIHVQKNILTKYNFLNGFTVQNRNCKYASFLITLYVLLSLISPKKNRIQNSTKYILSCFWDLWLLEITSSYLGLQNKLHRILKKSKMKKLSLKFLFCCELVSTVNKIITHFIFVEWGFFITYFVRPFFENYQNWMQLQITLY